MTKRKNKNNTFVVTIECSYFCCRCVFYYNCRANKTYYGRRNISSSYFLTLWESHLHIPYHTIYMSALFTFTKTQKNIYNFHSKLNPRFSSFKFNDWMHTYFSWNLYFVCIWSSSKKFDWRNAFEFSSPF